MAAGGAAYWSNRRKKQGGRAAGKFIKAFTQPSTSSIAKAAWSGVKYLRTLVNSETHKLDTTATGFQGNTYAVTHLSAIAQGDGLTNRTGNSVLASYLALRVSIANNALATGTLVRCIVFIDRQQISDTSPAGTDVYGTTDINSFLNANNVGRFQILMDRVFPLGNATRQILNYKKNIKLNKHIRFNGSAGSDIQKGGIYYMQISDQATNTPTISWNARLTWHDN